jgi:predicted HicB family RNase H-like nuclease
MSKQHTSIIHLINKGAFMMSEKVKKIVNKNYPRTLVIPITELMHEELRLISFNQKISMNQLARWGLEKIINKHKKSVDTVN